MFACRNGLLLASEEQRLAQRDAARAVQAGGDGLGGALEDGGDLLVGELVALAHQRRLARLCARRALLPPLSSISHKKYQN